MHVPWLAGTFELLILHSSVWNFGFFDIQKHGAGTLRPYEVWYSGPCHVHFPVRFTGTLENFVQILHAIVGYRLVSAPFRSSIEYRKYLLSDTAAHRRLHHSAASSG